MYVGKHNTFIKARCKLSTMFYKVSEIPGNDITTTVQRFNVNCTCQKFDFLVVESHGKS